MSTSDQWLSISSPDLGSKVLQGECSFYLYNSGAPFSVSCPELGQPCGINIVSLSSPGFQKPGWHTAGAHCRFEWRTSRNWELVVRVKEITLTRTPLQFPVKVCEHEETQGSSSWVTGEFTQWDKKNKNGLANFIPRKCVPFLSASVILDSIQTLMRHCQAFFFYKWDFRSRLVLMGKEFQWCDEGFTVSLGRGRSSEQFCNKLEKDGSAHLIVFGLVRE